MRLALTIALLATPALAETPLERERFENLGLFAGYAVACGVATEDEASAMVKKLGAGLGERWSRQDSDTFEQARDYGRKAKCPDQLRAAVERGWLNYEDAK